MAQVSVFHIGLTISNRHALDIRDGNSGSWVVDVLSYEVYGHLVASDAFRDGYVIPLAATLRDVKTELSAESICLPTRDEVHLWHVTSLSHSQAGSIQGHANTALQRHDEDLYDEPDGVPLASRDHTPTGKHTAADFLVVDAKTHPPVQDTKNDQQNSPPGTWNMQPYKVKPDWDKHKVAIFHLYQKEKKPLRDVMHIMVQKYGFVAS
jgi:Clr5 domain